VEYSRDRVEKSEIDSADYKPVRLKIGRNVYNI
jgi:hypothetical protein